MSGGLSDEFVIFIPPVECDPDRFDFEGAPEPLFVVLRKSFVVL